MLHCHSELTYSTSEQTAAQSQTGRMKQNWLKKMKHEPMSTGVPISDVGCGFSCHPLCFDIFSSQALGSRGSGLP
jgi:hypothetical protein